VNEEEIAAMKKFEENDKVMDEILDQIVVGAESWKNKGMLMGNKIDQTSAQIHTVTIETDKTNKTLMTSNMRLKKILEQYRKPNKFCLDIILILFILGLIVVVINMIRGG